MKISRQIRISNAGEKVEKLGRQEVTESGRQEGTHTSRCTDKQFGGKFR
jgi:hypothetical protein